MAIMIPSSVSPQIRSQAEKKIFEWFQNAPGTESWYVLHSLGIANHNTVIRGETDFLVLAPYLGLFAIEVKGGNVERLPNGKWQFTGRDGKQGTKNRSPWDQANDGIHSIIAYIKKNISPKYSHLQYVLFGSGIMFPDITYNCSDIEGDQAQVFDYRDSHKVRAYIERLSKYTMMKWHEKYGFSAVSKLPDADDVAYIAGLLRGQFDCPITLGASFQATDQKQVQLTKRQYACLDGLEDNARCLITGYAGTGKTLVAVEAARRFSAAGEKVALFCYNANLSDWLSAQCKEKDIQIAWVGSLHSYMTKLTGLTAYSTQDISLFYRETLPIAAYAQLNSSESDRFDRIIVDEAQDLLSFNYLRVLNLLVKRGLSRGKWVMLGDLAMQAIYSDQSPDEMIECLEKFASVYARYTLKQNCRNTKQICQGIKNVTGLNLEWQHGEMIEGEIINWVKWSSVDEEKDLLVKIINHLTENGINPNLITILSPKRRENSVVSQLSGIKVANYSGGNHTGITFSTIHAFKGLENRIVILTDIESLMDDKLLYIAMSRARTNLHILVRKDIFAEESVVLYRRYH